MRIRDWSSDVCSSDLVGVDINPASGIGEGADADKVWRNLWGHYVQQVEVACDKLARAIGLDATEGGGFRGSVNGGQCAAEVQVEIGRASCRERVCQYV